MKKFTVTIVFFKKNSNFVTNINIEIYANKRGDFYSFQERV